MSVYLFSYSCGRIYADICVHIEKDTLKPWCMKELHLWAISPQLSLFWPLKPSLSCSLFLSLSLSSNASFLWSTPSLSYTFSKLRQKRAGAKQFFAATLATAWVFCALPTSFHRTTVPNKIQHFVCSRNKTWKQMCSLSPWSNETSKLWVKEWGSR